MADLQKLVDELSKLTVLEAAELSKKLEEAWGVSAAGPVGVGGGGGAPQGTSAALLQDPAMAVAKARKDDVPLLYWSAASWGAAISLGIDRPDLAVDFPSVRALADRALALDPSWNKGAIHELMISLDSLPEALGGNADRARVHFKTALEIQKGLSPGPYVALATGVAVPMQDRAEFERLLKEALAIDPEKDPSNRLVILVTQRRARVLLDRADEKFSK